MKKKGYRAGRKPGAKNTIPAMQGYLPNMRVPLWLQRDCEAEALERGVPLAQVVRERIKARLFTTRA